MLKAWLKKCDTITKLQYFSVRQEYPPQTWLSSTTSDINPFSCFCTDCLVTDTQTASWQDWLTDARIIDCNSSYLMYSIQPNNNNKNNSPETQYLINCCCCCSVCFSRSNNNEVITFATVFAISDWHKLQANSANHQSCYRHKTVPHSHAHPNCNSITNCNWISSGNINWLLDDFNSMNQTKVSLNSK